MSVTLKGPLFDGRAAAATERITTEIEKSVAEMAVNRVHAYLSTVLKHPTGYYESHIQTDRSSSGDRVTDGGVIYGPWLEGVGSRNQTTRFKGYATFRHVSQEVDRDAGPLADSVAAKHMKEMN